jgi:hypothetical protein
VIMPVPAAAPQGLAAPGQLPEQPRVAAPTPSTVSPPMAHLPAASGPSSGEFVWGECRVLFSFGRNSVKPDKMVGIEALRIKNYDGFSGEGSQQLSDLATLLQQLQDEVERGMWSEETTSAILRANIVRTARTLVKNVLHWRDILTTLFKAFATERALAACAHELRSPKMRVDENAHTFVARAVRLFELYGRGISDGERARILLEELTRHAASFPRGAEDLLFQLRTVTNRPEANYSKVAVFQGVLRDNAAVAVMMRPKRTDDQRRGDLEKKKDRTKTPAKKVCWDCGSPGELVGHTGCKTPGSKRFAPREKLDQKAPPQKQPGEKKAGDKKPAEKKQAKATLDDKAATPIVRLSLTLENGMPLVGVLDSGATDHYISATEARRLGLELDACMPVQVGSAEVGGGFVVTARATARVFLGESVLPLMLSVSEGLAETLLSFRALLQACPNTSWASGQDGAESLIISGIPFLLDESSRLWTATKLSSEEFSARASRLSGPEAKEDPASAESRYSPSAWLAAVDAQKRPKTRKEALARGNTEPFGKEQRMAQLTHNWFTYLTLGVQTMPPGLEEFLKTMWALAERCVMAESGEEARKEICRTDLEMQKQALAASTAQVMMRTVEPDVEALARITGEMQKTGAPTEAVKFFTDEIFWPSERRRVAALQIPVAPRGGDLDFEIELEPGAKFFHQRPRNFKPAEAELVTQYADQQVALGRGRYGTVAEAKCVSNWTFAPRADGTTRPCGAYGVGPNICPVSAGCNRAY